MITTKATQAFIALALISLTSIFPFCATAPAPAPAPAGSDEQVQQYWLYFCELPWKKGYAEGKCNQVNPPLDGSCRKFFITTTDGMIHYYDMNHFDCAYELILGIAENAPQYWNDRISSIWSQKKVADVLYPVDCTYYL